MKRRNFCKLLAGGAVTAALPFKPSRAFAQTPPHAGGFNQLIQSYAEFCATPERQRTFYAFRGANVVTEQLDEGGWVAPKDAWGMTKLDSPMPTWDGVPMLAPVPGLAGQGPFQATWESLGQYDCPEWYQDAKFGIWNHWSPQCVAEDGDWYARNMYIDDQDQYRYHAEHYGPPSRFGYKDLCAQWTLLNWQPDDLMDLYSRAGARLFLALANHHDGFDAWNSAHQPWNAQNVGPHRDVIGTWAKAARDRGMKFGVTVHQGRNWWWFQPSHGVDRSGPNAGVPYDGHLTLADGKGQWWEGLDPQRLYGPKHPPDALPDASYVKNFYDRTRDLIDQHDPDLLYFDNDLLPLGWGGMSIGAYFYNRRIARHGSADCVLNGKNIPPELRKALVADVERGLSSAILPHPWQSETCIGEWHYQRRLFEQPGEYGGYLPPADVIHWMADTVSKNGTFILNVPGRPDGTIDAKERRILEEIGMWMKINGEAIYATRPWKIYGEGPVGIKEGSFQGESIKKVTAKDIRYTRNKGGTVLYAIALGWPESEMVLASLGTAAPTKPGKIEHVELLGTPLHPVWKQTASALHVTLPRFRPAANQSAVLKIHLA